MFVSEEGEGEGAVFCVKGYFLCLVYKKGCKENNKNGKRQRMERESEKNREDEKNKKEREREE